MMKTFIDFLYEKVSTKSTNFYTDEQESIIDELVVYKKDVSSNTALGKTIDDVVDVVDAIDSIFSDYNSRKININQYQKELDKLKTITNDKIILNFITQAKNIV